MPSRRFGKARNKDMIISFLPGGEFYQENWKRGYKEWNRMEKEVILIRAFLKETYTCSRVSKNNLETVNQELSFLIREIGKFSKDAGFLKRQVF